MQPKTRPYYFYDTAVSICSTCYRRVDAKIVFMDGGVWMLKRCPDHGREKVLLADDIDYYKRAREVFVKVPEQVRRYNTPTRWGCPYDCGICPDHEQHGCTLLIEVTDGCNLRCPTCYAKSSPDRMNHRSLEQIERMLDLAVENEGEPNIVQISGGEPTIHPQFFEILDAVRARPIRHLLVNTNGIRIATEDGFAERLAAYGEDLEVYLQFDSFRAEALMNLRAADTRSIHHRAVAKLNQLDVSTSLVCTIRKDLNDDELGEIVEFALEQPCVRGVTFQPVQAAGRLENYDDGYQTRRDRLTLTEVRRKILEQTDTFAPEDIIPVPCHADNVAMAYALQLDGQVLPLTGLIDPEILIDGGRNTIGYEYEEGIQAKLFEAFSTSHSPGSQAASLAGLLDSRTAGQPDISPSGHPAIQLSSISYRNVFRLLIVAFIDAYDFDLRSIKKTCVHIVHPDGKRVIPFDTYNMLYRDELETGLLAEIRAERAHESVTARRHDGTTAGALDQVQ